MKMRTKNRMDEENQESMKLGIYKGGPQKLKSSGDRRYVWGGEGKCNNHDNSHSSLNEVCEEICKFIIEIRTREKDENGWRYSRMDEDR